MEIIITVSPGSKKEVAIVPVENPGGTLPAYHATLREKAVDGAANKALIALVAGYFGVPKSRVEITHGAASRTKRLRVG